MANIEQPGAFDQAVPLNSITYEIIGSAQKVHTALGLGFAEATYHAALCKELMLRQIPFESQREFEVFYENTRCGLYRPDLVVAQQVIVELKAVSKLCEEHRMQTISYLRASGLPVGLLLNFGAKSLEVRCLINKEQSVESVESV